MDARQPFFQILNSDCKKLTTVVICGRSLEYSQQTASTPCPDTDESRTCTQSHWQALSESIRPYWELEQN